MRGMTRSPRPRSCACLLALAFSGCEILGGGPPPEKPAQVLTNDDDRRLELLVRKLGDEAPPAKGGEADSQTSLVVEALQKQILAAGPRAIPILLRPIRHRELPPLRAGEKPFPTDGILQGRCIRTLERMGEPAVEPLVALAVDRECRRAGRQAALSALADWILGTGDRPEPPLRRETQARILAVLSDLLGDRDEQVVSRALGAIGSRAFQLEAYATNPDEGVRARATAILESLRKGPVRPRIEGLLANRDPFIRKRSAKALGAIGDPASLPVLRAREPVERDIRKAYTKDKIYPVYEGDAFDEVQKAIVDIRGRALRSPGAGGPDR